MSRKTNAQIATCISCRHYMPNESMSGGTCDFARRVAETDSVPYHAFFGLFFASAGERTGYVHVGEYFGCINHEVDDVTAT